ncbi:MAG: DinB family protein [Anaerolineales bacterium]
MADTILGRLFEHSNWANSQMIDVCSSLTDEQLDAKPQSATKGSIRQTLIHLVRSQQGYLSLLTLPVESRQSPSPAFSDLREAAASSGDALLALARSVPEIDG